MKNKDYRELQISSSVLIFIFLGIIIVGIVIFLLGVSVGKKQAEMAGVPMSSPERFEEVIAEKPEPVAEDKDPIGQELEGHETAQQDPETTEVVTQPQVKSQQPAQKKPPTPKPASTPPAKQKAATPASQQYYLQIGAFRSRESADSVVEKYESMGFPGQIIAPSSSDSRQLFRVVLGGYASRADAQQAKSMLIETEGQKASDYFIIQR
jgi:cell division protein FtsN